MIDHNFYASFYSIAIKIFCRFDKHRLCYHTSWPSFKIFTINSNRIFYMMNYVYDFTSVLLIMAQNYQPQL